MDDLITFYVQSATTQEAQEDIFQCLGLFQVFNYLDPYPVLQDILGQESFSDPTVTLDNFLSVLLVSQQYLLDRHGIVLTDDTTLAVNNEFLRMMYQLQRLEDPVPILTILENTEAREYKLAQIVEYLGNKPPEWTLKYVEQVRGVFTSLLGEYLYMQEDNQTVPRGEIPSIKLMVKIFKEVFGINQAIRVILDSNVVMGEKFSLYLPLYDELREIVEDENMLVETLLFMILYSSDGHQKPIDTFKAYSDNLVSDLTVSNRLGMTLAAMITKMDRYKEKLSHEKE